MSASRTRSRSHARDHDHGHAHHHDHGASGRAILIALLLTALFALVEAAGGFWAHSLALVSDAGHMFTDAAALGLGLVAQIVSRRPPSQRNSYGYARAEVIGAFVNALAMLAVVVWIAVEAVQRLLVPQPVAGQTVMLIAAVGLLINLGVAWTLSRAAHNLNTRAALLHVLSDLLGSVAAVVAGAVVYYTGWMPIDPLLSLAVALLILQSTWSLLRQTTQVLMEGVPHHLSYEEIGRAMTGQTGVLGVHDLHVWHMSSNRAALSAHVTIADPALWPQVLTGLQRLLDQRFGIDHVTLQPSWAPPPKGTRVIPLTVVGEQKPPLH
jgi:cobalt-zinc-cadmium efflux system protein